MFRLPTPPRPLIAITALTAALLVAGCSRTAEPKPDPGPAPGPAESEGAVATADTAVELADASEATRTGIVATVGGREISADDVAAVVDQMVREGQIEVSPKAIRKVLDAMIADAVVAEEARAEGFDDSAVARRAEDAALATLYLDQKTRAEAEAAITDEDIQRYWGPRRLATKLVVATRDEGSGLQQKLLEAIAATPERASEIFSDFRAKAPLTREALDQGASTPFDLRGQGQTGQPVVHARVAGAAFALPEPGAVSPPVEIGPGRWAVVQLLAIQEGVAPEALTPAQKLEAKQALVTARASMARRMLAARLRKDADVRVDDARLAELIATLARVDKAQRGRAGIDLKLLRRGRLKQLPSRLPPGARNIKDMRKGHPERDEKTPPQRRPMRRRPAPPAGETP